MSGGALPPVPDLIPIAALQRRPMGEQRPRRRAPAELIDNGAGSRGPSAAPQPPPSSPPPSRSRTRRRPGQRRRRKSDHRRREQRVEASARSVGKQGCRSNSSSSSSHSALDKPPRVNPIFVWVRQEDTRIVDVKCEDYDKRNRILLTKTAHGWRAIPRTETLAPSLGMPAEEEPSPPPPPSGDGPHQHHHHHHHHRHHRRRPRKSKGRQKTASVQFPESQDPEPSWIHSENVNVESLLPSHTIHVKRTASPSNVNSAVSECARAPPDNKVCDVSPLDNLLAVAELEFKQQIESGEWNAGTVVGDDDANDVPAAAAETSADLPETKSEEEEDEEEEEGDYNEDDETSQAMNDILSRLEQSLQSPESNRPIDEDTPDVKNDEPDDKTEPAILVESSTNEQDQPTDLSLKKKNDLNVELTIDVNTAEGPTDLSLKKNVSSSPRPPSQSSEAIQSPQPSGIPAVPQSPDTVSTSSVNTARNKSVFLESLLNSSQKVALNSEVTITRQKEPLDLGSCRKSASPTVTCSEEIINQEPPAKKFKPDEITLKNLLDRNESKDDAKASSDPLTEFKRLLNETELPDPLMVPKEAFPNLLKHPRREILKLLGEKAHKDLHIEDILVIYKDKLMAALEANSTNASISDKKEQTEKLKRNETAAKNASGQNISANDIDAATEAAFNQMMWFPYQNQDIFQALYSSLPFMPNQFGELPPGLQMMLGNRVPPLSPVPPMNFTNPLEFAMWQEAMMQANLLRTGKNPYETSILNQPFRDPKGPKKSPTVRMPAKIPQQHLQGVYGQSNLSNHQHQNYQNPYLGLGGFQQGSNNISLNVPQYHPFHQKTGVGVKHHHQHRGSYLQKQKEAGPFNPPPPSADQQRKMHPKQHTKHNNNNNNKSSSATSKPFPSNAIVRGLQPERHHPSDTTTVAAQRQANYQPIDLSGSHHHHQKAKGAGKFAYASTTTTPSSKGHHEEVAEVGSTTASIEEMQDAHTHLWHPLFGSNKGYGPWGVPPVTATGE